MKMSEKGDVIKMKKILILGLIVCSLLIVSIDSVVAVDETKTIVDDQDDVIDDMMEEVSSSENVDIDNIDIIKLTYSKEGKNVILTLQVAGEIEDRGDIGDIDSEFDKDIDLIEYSLALATSTNEYDIYYVNKECQIYYSYSDGYDAISPSVDNDTLTVSFELQDADETYYVIYAGASYRKLPDLSDYDFDDLYDLDDIDYEWLIDFAIDEEGFDDNDDDGTNGDDDDDTNNDDTDGTNENSNKDESSDSGLLLFGAIIAIMVVVGVIVVIAIIRR